MVVLGPILVIVLIAAIFVLDAKLSDYHSSTSSGNVKRDTDEALNRAEEMADRYGYSSNPKTVLRYMGELDAARSKYGNSSRSSTRYSCEDTMSGLSRQYSDLMAERWEKRAQGYLQTLEAELYRIFDDAISDEDLTKMSAIRDRILSQYDKYWKWTEECSAKCETDAAAKNLWQEAREQMRFYLEDNGDINLGIKTWWGVSANLSVRGQMVKALDKRINALRPECRRKTELMERILNVVYAEGEMLRANLAKKSIDGATKEEILSACRLLVKTNRLSEKKVGSRYVVSLSDKEREKFKRSNAKKENPVIHAAAPEIKQEKPSKSSSAITQQPTSSKDQRISSNILSLLEYEGVLLVTDLDRYDFGNVPSDVVRNACRVLVADGLLTKMDLAGAEAVELSQAERDRRKQENGFPVQKVFPKTCGADQGTPAALAKEIAESQFDVLSEIEMQNIPSVDNLDKGGALWILGGHELDSFVSECREKGVSFTFKENGSRATDGRPAWWTNCRPQ